MGSLKSYRWAVWQWAKKPTTLVRPLAGQAIFPNSGWKGGKVGIFRVSSLSSLSITPLRTAPYIDRSRAVDCWSTSTMYGSRGYVVATPIVSSVFSLKCLLIRSVVCGNMRCCCSLWILIFFLLNLLSVICVVSLQLLD